MKELISWVMAISAMMMVAGCSVLLQWDEGDNPCNSDQKCFEGYSCLVKLCIADSSRGETETCTLDQQCQAGLECAPSEFQCLKPCTTYYRTPAACDQGQYCKPVINDNGDACDSVPCSKGACVKTPNGESRCRFFEGVCVESDGCVPDLSGGAGTGCKTSEVCVEVSPSATACLTGCEITWNTGYDDNCSPIQGDTEYCTPVGMPGSQRLACLDTTLAAETAGNPCSSVDSPCAPGAACTRPTAKDTYRCYDHCDSTTTSTCAGAFLCCAQLNNGSSTDPKGDTFGICVPTQTGCAN